MSDYLGTLLINLRGWRCPTDLFFIPKEKVLEELRRLSGQDFGDDVDAWLRWADEYRNAIQNRIEKEVEKERAEKSGRRV